MAARVGGRGCHIKIGQPDADAITDPNAPLTTRVDYVLTGSGITPLSENTVQHLADRDVRRALAH